MNPTTPFVLTLLLWPLVGAQDLFEPIPEHSAPHFPGRAGCQRCSPSFNPDGTLVKAPPPRLTTEEVRVRQARRASAPLPAPLEDTFKLHTSPGNTKTIYLDFDGHNGTHGNYTPYDFDGDSNTFSDAELEEIQRIWQSLHEDYRFINVNITTEYPDEGVEALRKTGGGDDTWGVHVVFSASVWTYSWDEEYFNSSSDVETFAYTGNVGTPPGVVGTDWTWAADSASHEVGHAFGLSHDGEQPGDGTYWEGHGVKGTNVYYSPIMGWSWTEPPTGVSQWCKGENVDATNTEDDLAILTATTGGNAAGCGALPDDHGSSTGSASVVNLFQSPVAEGVIGKTDDVDYFEFTLSQSEPVQLQIDPADIGPNLDVLARIHNSTGTVLHTSNPLLELDAEFDIILPAGTYYLSIEGTGYGDPATNGYSDYGSLGYYRVTSLITGGDNTPPSPDPMNFAVAPQATGSNSISMVATTATDSENGVVYYFTCTSGGGNDSGWQAGTSYTDTSLTPETAYTYTVTARDKSANQNATAASAALSATTETEVVNLVLAANGGVLESATSEFGSGWVASDLNNGVTNEDGWASTQNPGNQEIVFSFLNGKDAFLHEAVIHAGTAEGQYFCKDVEVWISADGSSYSPVASGTLPNTANTSIALDLGGLLAQKVKLVITSGYRNDYWELAEFEVTGVLATDYDLWSAQFPGADLSDPNADLDGNRLTNNEDRIWGLDPTNASSVSPISIPLDATGRFSFTRRDDALTGLTYEVWTSTDLLVWTEDTAAVMTPGSPMDEVETVAVTLSPILLAEPRLFFQVRAVK